MDKEVVVASLQSAVERTKEVYPIIRASPNVLPNAALMGLVLANQSTIMQALLAILRDET